MIASVKTDKFYMKWRLTISVSIVDTGLCMRLFQKYVPVSVLCIVCMVN